MITPNVWNKDIIQPDENMNDNIDSEKVCKKALRGQVQNGNDTIASVSEMTLYVFLALK